MSSANRLPIFALLAVILLAGVLRFYDLENCPAGLFRDEAEKGYNGWALATTGGALDFSGGVGPGPTVQWRRLPWMINVMGGRTSAIYQYASVPFIRAGGLTVASARRAAALAGTLAVMLLGVVLWRAWGAWPAVAGAWWLAVSPWSLVFSRWALEGSFVPPLLALVLLGLWGIEAGRRWGAPLAGAGLGWLFYSYSGAQPFVLAWGVCLALIYGRRVWAEVRRNPWSEALGVALGVALFLVPVAPTLLARLEPGGSTRLARIAIWGEPGVSGLGVLVQFIRNYFMHLNPVFLFFSGDAQPRHSVPGLGELPVVCLILLPIGLAFSFRRRRPWDWALLAAFLCGPIPAAITREGLPHALRSLPMAVPAAAWSGLGLAALVQWLPGALARRGIPWRRGRLLAGALVAVCLLTGINACWRYWRAGHEDPRVRVAFEDGLRQSWATLAGAKRPEQRVYINGYIPYVPYYELFFMRPAPRAVAGPGGVEAGGYIYFDPQRTPPDELERRMRPGDWLLEAALPAQVTLPDGQPLIDKPGADRAGELWVRVFQK